MVIGADKPNPQRALVVVPEMQWGVVIPLGGKSSVRTSRSAFESAPEH